MLKKALLLIDIQNDFLSGGSFPVANGNEILPFIEKLLDLPFNCIIATQDWHPRNHESFADNHNKKVGEKIILNGIEQILWPVHCVQHTQGAELHKSITQAKLSKIIFKGTDSHIDSYSAFFDNGRQKSTGLDDYLKGQQIEELYLAGLATDYCVKYSALDALQLGYKTNIIIDVCRGININPQNSDLALNEVQHSGARLTTYSKTVTTLNNSSS